MTETPLASAPERRETRRPARLALRVSAAAAIGVLLYLLSRSNYLLFHGIVELFGVIVCFAIFVVAWNTRRWVSSHFLLFLGIAYLFVAAVGIFHTLAYRGMGVFPSFTANQPTQFWVLARYVEAFSLLLAPLFLARRLRPVLAFVAFSLVTGFGLLSICRLGTFPDCFVDGQGLTTFKVVSEYVISAVLLAALGLLYRRRAAFESRVFRLLVAAILAGVGAEMAFTLYADVYGIANTVGHLFKVACFYFIYRAVVVTSLETPQELLFRTLAQERDRAQRYLDVAGVILIALDREGHVELINRKGVEVLGLRENEIVGRDWFQEFLPESRRTLALELFGALMDGRTEGAERTEGPVRSHTGGERMIAWHNIVLRDESGAVAGMLSSGEDVTEQRAAERALAASTQRLQLLFDRAPDGYYLSDLDGRFVDANHAAEDLVGYRKEELLGKSFLDAGLLRPQDVPAAAALLGRSMQGLPTGPDELALVRNDGNVVVVEIRTEPVSVEGRPLILGIARDATARKAAERALRESEEQLRHSNVELRELAARLDVAREEERAAVAWELHDQIAQALAVMKMDVVSCRRKLPQGTLVSVQPSLDKMVDLLDDTIARLRRLYTDLVPVMLEDLGLAATIEWQAEQVRRETGVDVRVGRVEDLSLPDDRTALGVFRVLQEALENAVRHPGATRVTVDLVPEDGHAVLRVADNGHGLSAEEAERAGTRELAGIRERARSWGGSVVATTSASGGTQIRVTVPLARERPVPGP